MECTVNSPAELFFIGFHLGNGRNICSAVEPRYPCFHFDIALGVPFPVNRFGIHIPVPGVPVGGGVEIERYFLGGLGMIRRMVR